MSGNRKRKRCAYDTNFKLKIIQYSEECKNNRETSRKCNVSEKLVRDCKKHILDLADLPRSKKARRGGNHDFLKKINFLRRSRYAHTVNKAILLCAALSTLKQNN